MFTFLVVVNAYSPVTGIVCLICLVFLFFESAFGICLGCNSIRCFIKVEHSPGEGSDPGASQDIHRQDIQKTSGAQLIVVFGLVVFILVVGAFFNGDFSKAI